MDAVRLVLLLRDTVISAEPICTSCLYADDQGRPRHRGEELLCAYSLPAAGLGNRFRCRMGFHLAQVHGY